jgi:uncharacterized DUF497 family protein
MINLEFEWDKRKAKANLKKHGISFEEARTIFFDEYAVQFFDPDQSEEEDRFILLGSSHILNTLVVCHCFRQEDTVVRIISARRVFLLDRLYIHIYTCIDSNESRPCTSGMKRTVIKTCWNVARSTHGGDRTHAEKRENTHYFNEKGE